MKTPSANRHTVLWADDDPDDLMIMREVLEQINQDHQVVEASNGRDVLKYLSTLHPFEYPCLIILDINMPVLNGRETLALIRNDAKYASIPVVMFTTSSSPKDQLYCRQHNATLYSKPNCFHEYTQAIKNLLAHCAGREAEANTKSSVF